MTDPKTNCITETMTSNLTDLMTNALTDPKTDTITDPMHTDPELLPGIRKSSRRRVSSVHD